MSEKLYRLTEEQVAELVADAQGQILLTRTERALLQLAADLSAAKERHTIYAESAQHEHEVLTARLNHLAEELGVTRRALSSLQEKARAVLAARSCCDPDCCKASSEHTKALEALAEELR